MTYFVSNKLILTVLNSCVVMFKTNQYTCIVKTTNKYVVCVKIAEKIEIWTHIIHMISVLSMSWSRATLYAVNMCKRGVDLKTIPIRSFEWYRSSAGVTYSFFPPEKWVYTSFSPGKISIYSFFHPERSVYTHLSPWFFRPPEPPWIRQWLSTNLFLRISTVYSTPRHNIISFKLNKLFCGSLFVCNRSF